MRETSSLKLGDQGWEPSFELENVTFAYPARPGHKALDNVSVLIKPGKFTAFVGPSGSGKSTIASLLLRLYDPQTATQVSEGDKHILKTLQEHEIRDKRSSGFWDQQAVSGEGIVRFASHNIRDLDLRWLRLQVSVVFQKPQLITGTIFENVAIGLTGTDLEYRSDTDLASSLHAKSRLKTIKSRIEEALRKAEAWDFVCDLPEGLSTRVTGGQTGVLSGGQLQRIALARALVRKPRCLLLDEATSAVSADTELRIQDNLIKEQQAHGMTLIIIAHRLSTVVHADKIIVMVAGRPVHSGTYHELLDPSCPDPTFRSMAQPSLGGPGKGGLIVPVELPLQEARSDQSASKVILVPETRELAQTSLAGSSVLLPPPMLSVAEAFRSVQSFIALGIVLCALAGSGFVLAGWLFGRAIGAYNDPSIFQTQFHVDRWALWYLVLAVGAFLVVSLGAAGLVYSGQHMVGNLRRETARALIRQDIPFFEDKSSGTGNLTAAASTHPSNVGAFVGLILAQILNSVANFLGTLILGFVLNWRISVMSLPGLAASMSSGYLNFILVERFEANVIGETSRQADFVNEAVNSFQMLAVLTRQEETIRLFRQDFLKQTLPNRLLIGATAALGFNLALQHFIAALLMFWGAREVARGKVVRSVSQECTALLTVQSILMTYTRSSRPSPSPSTSRARSSPMQVTILACDNH